ncbi:hypothetical protein PG1780B_1257 [Bifidobacterium pseudolongum subsp. globosum]|uniref:Uncharacterized protein n=1 Tax=Bifidobacterium pseudolongum subsp. globosum TaxID=1690 RepID=A0A8B3RML9_9BIFI|nr:hypothetical protein PG1780B_1257 [Bifidobacterium pseudolongum subsp. globosum]
MCRIIPAHAGQTASSRIPTPARPDHPRACGANSTAQPAGCSCIGSSPRMRGKQPWSREHTHQVRIIPAHAGQTGFHSRTPICRPDHPRACGANRRATRSTGCMIGSSPRMRGKQRISGEQCGRRRIIPAHAGQTVKVFPSAMIAPDHPRACGANTSSVFYSRQVIGSSPRMRGKHTIPANLEDGMRIIPAHAGQTPKPKICSGKNRDHSRNCRTQ